MQNLLCQEKKDEAAIQFDVSMYGIMLETMTGAKSLGRLKRYVVKNANILLKDSATIPDVKSENTGTDRTYAGNLLESEGYS